MLTLIIVNVKYKQNPNSLLYGLLNKTTAENKENSLELNTDCYNRRNSQETDLT